MWETIKNEWQAKVTIVLYLLLTLWWILDPIVLGQKHERIIGDFANIYFIMPLWGGIWGIAVSRKWGGHKSLMGKAILMFSLGLLAQVFGENAYAYYSFILKIAIPYPSLGDLGYFGSIPCYIYGTYLLAKASGTSIKLKSLGNKLQAIIIPLVMLTIGYVLFLRGYEFDWSNPLRVFLDFGYPLTQAIYISLALLTYLLSKEVLGGIMKSKILFILFALLIQFLSDYNFLYQVSRETWVTGGYGNMLYLSAYFTMTLALIQLGTVLKKLKE
ncbi:MAG: hypothetical protein HYV37_03515 [Candidatus Levyibacteriota bacterium]|nr:MAG: hypothetical protein HYV37_03515 [Candidatus Levybacteria bacterium]